MFSHLAAESVSPAKSYKPCQIEFLCQFQAPELTDLHLPRSVKHQTLVLSISRPPILPGKAEMFGIILASGAEKLHRGLDFIIDTPLPGARETVLEDWGCLVVDTIFQGVIEFELKGPKGRRCVTRKP